MCPYECFVFCTYIYVGAELDSFSLNLSLQTQELGPEHMFTDVYLRNVETKLDLFTLWWLCCHLALFVLQMINKDFCLKKAYSHYLFILHFCFGLWDVGYIGYF